MIRRSTSGGEYVGRRVMIVMLMNLRKSLSIESGGNDLPMTAKVFSQYRIEWFSYLVLDKLEILGN